MPSTTSKNLGQVSAVISGPTAPTNTNVMWLDTSGINTVKKIFNPSTNVWELFTQTGTVAGDNWGTQVIQHSAELTGDGTTGTPLKIAQQGATTGQVLKWSGIAWIAANDDTGTGISNVAHNADLAGNGTVGDPLKIAAGVTVGQVLKWNGTNWLPGVDEVGVQFSPGMIMMWCGTIGTIPGGWVLCDGQGNLSNGVTVPDLKGRFIVGYDPNDADYNAIGNPGGTKAVALTANQNGPHIHGINDPGHTHNSKYRGALLPQSGSATPCWAGNDSLAQTSLSVTGITIQQSGNGDAHENRPPYYTLAYIVKL